MEYIKYDSVQEQENIKNRKWFWQRHTFKQLILVFAPVANIFSSGMAVGLPTVLLPQLNEKYGLKLSDKMESWLYSVPGMATLPSLLILPILTECYGRRPIYSAMCIINVIGWIIEYFANSFTTILTAEILQGLSLGSNTVVGIIFLSECSNPKYRGSFLILKTASFVWGIWMVNTIGTFTDSKYACVLGFASSLFASIGMILLPESPVWLAGKGEYENCKKSFFSFRENSKNTAIEFNQLISYYSNDVAKTTISKKILILCKQFRLREFYLPFSVSVVCCSLSGCSGKMVTSVYALVIVKEITNDIALAYKIMLIIDAIVVAGVYAGCYLVYKVKRRAMLISSTLTGTVSLYLMSIFLFLSESNIIVVNSRIMLALLMIYSFAVSLGPLALTTSLFAEIVPHRYKSITSTSAFLALFGMHALFLKINPYLMRSIGLKGAFLLYASLSSLALLFLYCFLPETKDKTLVEIEEYFSFKKKDAEHVVNLKVIN